jgi:hypothetical protein
MNRAHTIIISAMLVSTGCADEQDFVIRPASSEALSLTTSTYPHDIEETPRAVASSRSLGTMVASSSGLYQLGTSGAAAISDESIVGLSSYGEAFLYASQSSISIWDGDIIDSGLNEFFDGQTFTGLAVFEDNIWIATQEGVYLHQPGGLIQFPELANVYHFSSFSGAAQIVLSATDGSSYLLENQDGNYSGQSLAAEPVSQALVGMQNSILAHHEGALMQRMPGDAENTVSWHPVALTTDAEDFGEQGVMQMLTDPQTGATWLRTQTNISRLQQGRVYTQALPSPTATLIGIADDASLWLTDDTAIYKLEGTANPVTFTGDVQAFTDTNCADCHSQGGSAHEIHSYEQWAAEIEKIIEVIEDGTMPAGGRELQGGTVQLLYKWLEDGLRP